MIRKLLLLTSVLVLVLSVVLPTVALADSRLQNPSHDQQLKIIKNLWGKDITIGDFLEKVRPEDLYGRTKDQIEKMYEAKMVWPDRSKKNSPIAPTYYLGEVIHYNYMISYTSPNLLYTSGSFIYWGPPSLPYMCVFSWLYKNSMDNLVDWAYDDGYNLSSVRNYENYQVTDAGYYRLEGSFTGEWPDFTWYVYAMYTDWVYFAP
jgi:hypothetical protein